MNKSSLFLFVEQFVACESERPIVSSLAENRERDPLPQRRRTAFHFAQTKPASVCHLLLLWVFFPSVHKSELPTYIYSQMNICSFHFVCKMIVCIVSQLWKSCFKMFVWIRHVLMFLDVYHHLGKISRYFTEQEHKGWTRALPQFTCAWRRSLDISESIS